MKKNYVISIIIVTIFVGGLGFFVGMQYQKTQQRSAGGFFRGNVENRFGQQQGQRKMMMGSNSRSVVGEITSMDDTSVTVKMSDGSSRIVILSTNTFINKQATGSKDDLKPGENILVIGTSNSDGSVTAANIQLNPQMRMMRGESATSSGK